MATFFTPFMNLLGQTQFTRGGVDTGDPQGAELAFALTTVTVSVLTGLHHRLFGDPVYAFLRRPR